MNTYLVFVYGSLLSGLHSWKRPGAASLQIDDLWAIEDAVALIGHCRWATHGTCDDNRNNHPHRAGQGWLVHNGQVTNYLSLAERYKLKARGECDSEVLGLMMAKVPGNLTTRARRVVREQEGRMAFLALWANPARIVFARSGNPLHVGETSDSCYFGSLPHELPGRVIQIADGQVGTLTLSGRKLACDIP